MTELEIQYILMSFIVLTLETCVYMYMYAITQS